MTARDVLAWLRRRGSARNVAGMAHYGIRSPKVLGVSMATMRPLVRRIGRDHDLALALWKTGWLEARILASFIDDPARVTAAQMEAWLKDFDSWAVCDSVCLHLFDRTKHAWPKALQWTRRKPEYQRRAGFALIAGLATHDKRAADRDFEIFLPIIAAAAGDERHFVKKAVNWALRQIGKRSRALNRRAIATAATLSRSASPAARWVARDALRELTNPKPRARLRR